MIKIVFKFNQYQINLNIKKEINSIAKSKIQSTMINFASLFNQFRATSNNSINELLEQNDITLNKLLDEDLFINQFKAGNNKLIEFIKYHQVKQLVDLITVVGPPEDKKRSYKFPLTAADALSCDLSSIADFFFPQDKLYHDKITIQQQVVEIQIDDEDQLPTKINQTQTKIEPLIEKQKTIIKDSFETNDQQLNNKPRQPQNTSQTQSETSESEQKAIPKPKIKVKKIQQVQKVQKIEVQPLIHQLFKYFDQQINYILTGYVCKVLTSLFNKKGNQMMEFLFHEARVEKMISHIESRSVGEFLLKILTFESSKYASERGRFFTNLLNKLSENNSIYVLSNFSSFISQTIQKAASNAKSTSAIPQFTKIFFTPQVVTIVIRNVMSEHQNVSIYNAPILLTYLNNVPFTLPQDEKIVNQFRSLLEMFIDKSLEKLNVTKRQRTKLGVGRVKIIQILNYILKENLLGSRAIISKKQKAFEVLLTLCKNYELNNVLHNQVVKMISLAFSDSNLSQSLIRKDVLLNFLHTQAQQDLKIRNKCGPQKFRKGFIGHVVQLSRLVQQYAAKDNQVAIKILETNQFDKVLTILVEKQVSEGNKSLGGFSFKRDIKTQIMFQKQDIITHYIDFLTHSPKPVFQKQPEPINIEHPDFLEQMERQIQDNLSNEQKLKSQQKTDEKKMVEEASQTISQPQLVIHINFFKGHLDYDVEDLMKNL